MKKGFATWATLIIIALVLIGAVYFLNNPGSPTGGGKDTPDVNVTKEEAASEKEELMENGKTSENLAGEESQDSAARVSYSGEVLAGTKALLLDFNNDDYQKALSEKDVVVLYFYANWCPICKAEFPKMKSAFEKLETSNVIGFRVNFNDNQTDSQEKELAKEFGVAYQHTKVILKNGERVLKSPETWEEERYLLEINNLLN